MMLRLGGGLVLEAFCINESSVDYGYEGSFALHCIILSWVSEWRIHLDTYR